MLGDYLFFKTEKERCFPPFRHMHLVEVEATLVFAIVKICQVSITFFNFGFFSFRLLQ